MKKSELRKIIKEEIKIVLKEELIGEKDTKAAKILKSSIITIFDDIDQTFLRIRKNLSIVNAPGLSAAFNDALLIGLKTSSYDRFNKSSAINKLDEFYK